MDSKVKTPDNGINIYFFIGRTNPPHQAHIDVLIETIRLSGISPHKYPALFLLGDGPGGIRTRDNPVEHELKKQFIVEKLRDEGFTENVDFVIERMEQPPNLQVEEFIKRFISDEDDRHVTIYQVAGGKDNDGAKHSRIRDDICKQLRELYKKIPLIAVYLFLMYLLPVRKMVQLCRQQLCVKRQSNSSINIITVKI